MSAFTEYIKSTKTELRHVAWPTQFQTIVYTALVIGVSIFVALYIGAFDFLFTRGLQEVVRSFGGSISITRTPAPASGAATGTPQQAPALNLNPSQK